MILDKPSFEDILLSEGYHIEKGARYPSVIVFLKGDVKKTYRQIHALSKERGYGSSFAVRLYHEGMNVYPEMGAVSDSGVEADSYNMEDGGVPEAEPLSVEEPVISEPAALSDDVISDADIAVSDEPVKAPLPAAEKEAERKEEKKEEKLPEKEIGVGESSQMSMFDMFDFMGGMGA